MFSQIASGLHSIRNPLYRLRDELASQGRHILDLVSGNVNEHGIVFPQALLERILVEAAREAQTYRPDSFGQKGAREAISSYYREQGVTIPPENILLTPGTSISYWYCFKLLANEGEEILCPHPSYPLFDYIAALSGVRMVPYRLQEERDWDIDIDHLDSSVSTKTRALILISPHNPTGHVASVEEIHGLAEVALRHGLAIISDEVFSEFLFREGGLPRAATSAAPLVLTLNGFSKMFALPGIKLGWMAVSGEEEKARQAMRILELISDTFLPVNEVVQAATPAIFREGQLFLKSYAGEIRKRWMQARDLLTGCSRVSFVEPEGGFYVTLLLEGLSEERSAEVLLRECHLLVHPGYFYDIDPDHLVLSFVQRHEVIGDAFPRLLATLQSL